MALSARQYKALELMGIPVWERHSFQATTEQQKSEVSAVADLQLERNYILLMQRIELNASEHRLLSMILKAIHLTFDQVQIVASQQMSDVLAQSQSQHTLIVFDQTIEVSEVDKRVIQTDSLEKLLEKPILKQQLWSQLRLVNL